MKKCALICLSPYSGGMEIDTLKLANLLCDRMAIILIVKRNSFIENIFSEYEKDSIKLKTVDFSSHLSPRIIFCVRRIIQEENIRNVIFFGASELKSLYFSFMNLGINLIVRHGTTKSTPKKDFFHRLIYSKVSYHIAISRHISDNIKKIIPFGTNTQLKLIYSSIKLGDYEKIINNKIKILHVGRIAHGKGQDDAVKACSILFENKIDFEFSIVGGSDDKGYLLHLKKLINSLPYKNSINLLGHQNNLPKILKDHSIFLFPSHGEGLGNSFLEALYFNLICISYNNTAFPELQELGLYFHMVSNKSMEMLKEKLLYVCKNIEKEQLESHINVKITQKIFSKEIEKKQFLEIMI